MRLSNRLRWTLYGVFAVLIVSGAAWMFASSLKDRPDGEFWQKLSSTLLMTHGGAAMLALLVLGALGPLHIARSWRSRKNRATGGAMVIVNALLIVSAFALYYLGSEDVRLWVSNAHMAFGLGLPLLLIFHIARGRMMSRQKRAVEQEPEP